MDVRAAASADINAVLQQMRTLRDQAAQPLRETAPGQLQQLDRSNPSESAAAVKTDFGALLGDAVQTVNQLQKTSGAGAAAFARGEETDLIKVMIDSQKSSIGFQAMVQVRNRMVTAYQDIMNMPI
ncbi:MAG: flagellar hook-basal body complex protein FliE [Pseudomonadota bacterium]